MDGDTLVANDGAVASYSCVDGYMLDGEISTLECVAMNDTVNLVWYPSAPSACVESKLASVQIHRFICGRHINHYSWDSSIGKMHRIMI